MLSTESPQHPSVVSLTFASACLCQIPPAVVLRYPALSSPSPVFSPEPSLFPTRTLLFAQSPCVPGCLLPCPLPQGRLHPRFSQNLSPHPSLHHPMDPRATQQFSSSQLCSCCCNGSQCLRSAIPSKILPSFCTPIKPFPSKPSAGV